MKAHSPEIIFLMFILISGCNRKFYAPTPQNAPLLSDKNELRVSGNLQNDDNHEVVNLEAAYSPLQGIGIIAGFYHGYVADSSLFKFGEPYSGDSFEIGAGVYDSLNNCTIGEIYGGFGKTSVFYPWNHDTVAPVKYARFFLQPAIGFKRYDLEFIFSQRFSFVYYLNIAELQNFRSFDTFEFPPQESQLYFFLEPAVTFRCGYKKVMGQIQIQTSYLAYGPPVERFHQTFSMGFLYSPFN